MLEETPEEDQGHAVERRVTEARDRQKGAEREEMGTEKRGADSICM